MSGCERPPGDDAEARWSGPVQSRGMRGLVGVTLLLAALAGCGGKTAGGTPKASDDSGSAGDGVATSDGVGTTDGAGTCSEVLFGKPGAHTGLDATRCAPRCGCGDTMWQPRGWSDADLAELRAWQLVDPPALPAVDPYTAATLDVAPPPTGAVCAVALEAADERRYRLLDFATAAEAAAANTTVTHTGRCGLCSSLADLAVYAGTSDLTDPVRQCGLLQIADGFDASVVCLQKLGFSPPCATIWAYNTANTRKLCLGDCMALLKAPSHREDGSLNACLACDEDKSGPVFKAVAGRTRRNSGLPSALCRPCAGVAKVDHMYLFLK